MWVAVWFTGCVQSACEVWYLDADNDGYGSELVSQQVCGRSAAPAGFVTDASDCDDTNDQIHPRQPEVCDDAEVDEDCDGFANDLDRPVQGTIDTWADRDGDGFGDPDSTIVALCVSAPGRSTNADDCNDEDAFTFPGAAELEDDIACMTDADEDGYGDLDCDDTDASIYPGAPERFGDGIDRNCDGDTSWFKEDTFESGTPDPLLFETVQNVQLLEGVARSGVTAAALRSEGQLTTLPFDVSYDEVEGGCANPRWFVAARRGSTPPAVGDVLLIEGWTGAEFVELDRIPGAGGVDLDWFELGDLLPQTFAGVTDFRLQIRASTMAAGAAYLVDDVWFGCTGLDIDGDGYGQLADCDEYDRHHYADCGRCIDKDGDGFGVDCDLGPDCDDTDDRVSPLGNDATPSSGDADCNGFHGPLYATGFEVDETHPVSVNGATFDDQHAQGRRGLRIAGGSSIITPSLNAVPCTELAWSVRVLEGDNPEPGPLDVLTVGWTDSINRYPAVAANGSATPLDGYLRLRGTIDHPLAFWLGNTLEISVSGSGVYHLDDLAFGCNPEDLDGDGWWGVMEDCDDTDAAIGPGQPDPLDGVDRDCDGFDGPA